MRELAIAGARHLSESPPETPGQRAKLEKLAGYFERPETAPWDWDYLRESKRHAWPLR